MTGKNVGDLPNGKNVTWGYFQGGFTRLNFQPRDHVDERGKVQCTVTMTKDGVTILAMGFVGASAMACKITYITAFNAMADHIANQEQKQMAQSVDLVDAGDCCARVGAVLAACRPISPCWEFYGRRSAVTFLIACMARFSSATISFSRRLTEFGRSALRLEMALPADMVGPIVLSQGRQL